MGIVLVVIILVIVLCVYECTAEPVMTNPGLLFFLFFRHFGLWKGLDHPTLIDMTLRWQRSARNTPQKSICLQDLGKMAKSGNLQKWQAFNSG